ncbi:MAG: DEAD/DEAH box helicase, partial [Flavobacteriales bacterium]|nr:DEAD/DEAH box helicase [Flavobacteriales bacterium]
KVLKIPGQVEIFDSTYEEKQAFAREIDRQKRKEDPSYQGAFHEKKKAKKNQPNKANRKTIQAYKFITEESKKKKKKGGKNTKRRK